MERDWIDYVRDHSDKLVQIKRDFIEGMLIAYMLEDGMEREAIKSEIDSILDVYSRELLLSKKPFLSIPSEEEAGGEIILGRVLQGEEDLYDFGLSMDELNQHVLIVGRSGSGKTTLIMNIIDQLLKNKIPFLAFDFKRDLRHLIRVYPELWVFRHKDLRLNLLQPPPGVSLMRWEQLFCDLYAFNYGWFHGSRNMLQEYLHELYEEKGERATLKELYEVVRKASERTRKRQEYYDVVLNRLFSTVTNLGEVVECEEGFRIEELLDHFVVIELDQLARDEQNLLVEYFLFWIYAYRLSKGHRGRLRHVLIFDEAKRVFDANKELRESTRELGIAPIDLIADEIRDFGEALIVSDQEPSKLTHSIKANTYTKITGFLGHGKDVDEISEAMDLRDEERRAITMLERGEWIVKLAGRYVKPFLIRSKDFPLEKSVTDEELEEMMRPVLLRLRAIHPVKETEKTLSEDAWNLLIHVNEHPFSGIASRARALRISGRRVESAKNELIEKGLVDEVSIQLTAKKPIKFLVPTQRALNMLDQSGMDISLWKRVGNVGFEHMLYQVLIRWGYQKLGYEARIEARVGKRRVDVLALKGKDVIGVEIELNPYNEIESKLDVVDSLTRLYILSNDDEKLRIIAKRVGKREKVRLLTVRRFLKSLNIARNKSGNYSSRRDKAEFN